VWGGRRCASVLKFDTETKLHYSSRCRAWRPLRHATLPDN